MKPAGERNQGREQGHEAPTPTGSNQAAGAGRRGEQEGTDATGRATKRRTGRRQTAAQQTREEESETTTSTPPKEERRKAPRHRRHGANASLPAAGGARSARPRHGSGDEEEATGEEESDDQAEESDDIPGGGQTRRERHGRDTETREDEGEHDDRQSEESERSEASHETPPNERTNATTDHNPPATRRAHPERKAEAGRSPRSQGRASPARPALSPGCILSQAGNLPGGGEAPEGARGGPGSPTRRRRNGAGMLPAIPQRSGRRLMCGDAEGVGVWFWNLGRPAGRGCSAGAGRSPPQAAPKASEGAVQAPRSLRWPAQAGSQRRGGLPRPRRRRRRARGPFRLPEACVGTLAARRRGSQRRGGPFPAPGGAEGERGGRSGSPMPASSSGRPQAGVVGVKLSSGWKRAPKRKGGWMGRPTSSERPNGGSSQRK